MKLNEHDMENVDAYLLGKLQGDALNDFEQRLKEEEDFAANVEEMQALKIAAKKSTLEDKMKLLQKEELKLDDAKLRKLSTDTSLKTAELSQLDSDKAKNRKMPWMKILSVAASVLVIGAAGYWWSGEIKANRMHDLFVQEHISSKQIDFQIIRSNSEVKLVNGVNAFNNQHYDVSSELLIQAYEETGDTLALYYSALSFLALKDYSKAKTLLLKEEIAKSKYATDVFLNQIK